MNNELRFLKILQRQDSDDRDHHQEFYEGENPRFNPFFCPFAVHHGLSFRFYSAEYAQKLNWYSTIYIITEKSAMSRDFDKKNVFSGPAAGGPGRKVSSRMTDRQGGFQNHIMRFESRDQVFQQGKGGFPHFIGLIIERSQRR